MKKAFFISAILSFVLGVTSLEVHASLTDEETIVLARATPGGQKRLAATIIAAGYDSLDDWLDSLAAPVVPPVPPVDADIQGLLNALGPIPVGTMPLTRTQQALNIRNKLDNTTGTVEQAMTSTEAKFAGLGGAYIVQQADGVVDALDSTLVGVNRTLNNALTSVQGKLAGLGGADITAQIDTAVDALDSTLVGVNRTLNQGLTSAQDKLAGLGGADITAQIDTAVDGLDSTLVGVNRTLDNGLASVQNKIGATAGGAIPPGGDIKAQINTAVGVLNSTLGAGGTLNQGLAVIADMKANLGNDGDGGAHIVGALRTVGNYPLINSGTSTLAPKTTFADGRDVATYLAHINQ
ncbi:MAG: hypothetical protein ACTHJ4_04420 [Candidatus Nucleicultricaceae bacterium]